MVETSQMGYFPVWQIEPYYERPSGELLQFRLTDVNKFES